jgi:hypothetical protein
VVLPQRNIKEVAPLPSLSMVRLSHPSLLSRFFQRFRMLSVFGVFILLIFQIRFGGQTEIDDQIGPVRKMFSSAHRAKYLSISRSSSSADSYFFFCKRIPPSVGPVK